MRYDIVRFKSGGFSVRVTRRNFFLFKDYSYIDAENGREWLTAEFAKKYCLVKTYREALAIMERVARQVEEDLDVGEIVSGPYYRWCTKLVHRE